MVVIEEVEPAPAAPSPPAPSSTAAGVSAPEPAAAAAVATTPLSSPADSAQHTVPQTRAADLKSEGNTLFASGDYEDAMARYLDAVRISDATSPEVAIFKANIAACYMKQENYEEAVSFCTQALEVDPKYVKALVRRAQAHEKLGGLEHLTSALEDYKRVLELEPGNQVAKKGATELTIKVDEERERQKNEMLGKLKDLGNMFLGKFGMSVDNFKFDKDPNTGSYSVNFVNNPHGGQPPSSSSDN